MPERFLDRIRLAELRVPPRAPRRKTRHILHPRQRPQPANQLETLPNAPDDIQLQLHEGEELRLGDRQIGKSEIPRPVVGKGRARLGSLLLVHVADSDVLRQPAEPYVPGRVREDQHRVVYFSYVPAEPPVPDVPRARQ